jgi:hypothetical protein
VPFGKNTKTVELAAGKVLMLYKFENMVRLPRYLQPSCCSCTLFNSHFASPAVEAAPACMFSTSLAAESFIPMQCMHRSWQWRNNDSRVSC